MQLFACATTNTHKLSICFATQCRIVLEQKRAAVLKQDGCKRACQKSMADRVGANLRGGAGALMPRKAGERAAREPKRYSEDEEEGDTLARLVTPEPERASPPGPAGLNGPAEM